MEAVDCCEDLSSTGGVDGGVGFRDELDVFTGADAAAANIGFDSFFFPLNKFFNENLDPDDLADDVVLVISSPFPNDVDEFALFTGGLVTAGVFGASTMFTLIGSGGRVDC